MPPARVYGATAVLAKHHGTRGSDPMVNITDCNGFVKKVKNIKPDEWRCPNQECQKSCPDPRGYWIFANKDNCNRCNHKRPAKPAFFKNSKWAKQAVGNGGNGGGGGPPKAGGKEGGGAAESSVDKELRLLRKQDADREKQNEIDKLKRKLKTGAGNEDESEGAESGDAASLEKLQTVEKS